MVDPATIAVSVVGWFVSPIIKELIDKAKSYVVKKYKWRADFPDKLKSVVHFLDEISCTVSLVKEQWINDPNMMRWLSQLEDVIDEVEDIFDEFDYEILLKNHDGTQASCSAAEPGAHLIGTEASFESLEKLLKKLDDIRQSSRGLVQASLLAATAGCVDGRSGSRSFTGPLLPLEPFGYKDKYGDLTKKLLEGSARVVAIVGHGGMGKTTLAQRACNDVKGEFDLVIWACVYNKFSEADLLSEIWKSVIITEKRDTKTDNLTSQTSTISRHGEMSFSSLQLALEKLVASKRFLLVLDDVCNNEMATELQRRETWSNVLAPFKNGNSGSRILVTTRAKICAKTLDAGARITLDGIDRESFIRLIKRTVSANDEAGDIEEFLKSNVVSEGSNFSPLAAKEMGLMLRTTRNRKRWGEILRTDCHENVISAHMSSYQHLPPHLQGCFAFCSIFPDTWKFDPEMLVKMWIAHGFIGDGLDGKSMEDVARGYFNDLLSRSFFQAIKESATTHYVIHQQIHSMIRLVSANYFMMIQGSSAEKIPLTVRHLSVTSGWLAQLRELCVLKRLRTLLVFEDRESESLLNAISDEQFRELKGVRVLDLSRTGITLLPQVIGSLIHLRYLALPDNLLGSLPAAVTKLFHLQTLIGSKDCCSINLVCAQINLEQLAAMNSLRGKLSITGLEAVANKEGAQRAQIEKKKNVRELHFEWEVKGENSAHTSDHLGVLEGLQPHTGLEVLHIRRYRGISSPTWLANNCLEQLTRLELINCRKWEVLPPFGHLPLLNYLEIREMNSVRQIDGSGSFKSLETLVLCDMPCLVEWAAGDTDSIFTSLRKGEISHCPELVKLPPELRTLKQLRCPKLQPIGTI